ncbi:MAG: hypothetical protein ACE37F_02035 [Nannocystaceae bacterium]|nr:hypothetical protein [bacterium]
MRRMNPDGSLAAILSEEHAVAARWIGDSDALVFLDGMGRLVQLDGSGDEHIVATVPLALPCPSDAFSEPELGLHMDEEFWITADGSHACLSLSDAFPNMRNVERQVAVRLSDGHVRAQLFLGGDECGQPQAQESIDVCATRPSPTWPEVDSPLPGGAVHSVSPDGAWTLVEVGSELGDVSHVQYVLVRNEDGDPFPMPYESGPWPSPVALPEALDPDTLVPDLPDMQGGETITWVGPHHLVLDQVLYIAGERVVFLGGDVAP